MQNLRKLKILEVYRQLPFVVYKGNYLIPQRPYPWHLPPSVSDVAMLHAPKQLASEYYRITIEGHSNYRTSLLQYIQFYVLPSRPTTVAAIALKVCLKHNQKTLKKRYDSDDPITPEELRAFFEKLPDKFKQLYLKKAGQLAARHEMKRKAYDHLFKIPTLKVPTPKELYYEEHKRKQKVPSFEKLKPEVKQMYKQRSVELQREANKTMKEFLQGYSLSQKQLEAIREVCNRTAKCVELYDQYVQALQHRLQIPHKLDMEQMESAKAKEDQIYNTFKEQQNSLAAYENSALKTLEELLQVQPNPRIKIDQFTALLQELRAAVKQAPPESIKRQEPEKHPETQKENQNKMGEQAITQKEVQNIKQSIKPAPEVPLQKDETPQIKAEQIIPRHAQPQDKPIERPSAKEEKAGKKTVKAEEFSLEEFEEEMMGDLKEEELNDLEILEHDYEELRLLKMIEKEKKRPVPAKKINF